jgi:hypothetical protein
MLAHVYLKKGCVVPRHSHENEQLTYVLEGALHFWLGEDESEEVVVRAARVLTIPSHLPHKALALEDTLDVDIFSPPREGLARGHGRVPAALSDGSSTRILVLTNISGSCILVANEEVPDMFAKYLGTEFRQYVEREHERPGPLAWSSPPGPTTPAGPTSGRPSPARSAFPAGSCRSRATCGRAVATS